MYRRRWTDDRLLDHEMIGRAESVVMAIHWLVTAVLTCWRFFE